MTRLLGVDDDLSTLVTFRSILGLAGYEFVGTQSGEAALALIETPDEQFDIVLCDLRLPDISGLEVLAAIRESLPCIPVVMISAWGTTASEKAARQLGAVDFLCKPICDADLIEAVQKNLLQDVASRPQSEFSDHETIEGYAASRWATLVVPVTRLKGDVFTLEQWRQAIGKSRSTIEAWCHSAGVRANDTLDFARALRIVTRHEGHRCDWYNQLAIVDSRTMAKFLKRGGLPSTGIVPSTNRFMIDQRFIYGQSLISAVRALLDSSY